MPLIPAVRPPRNPIAETDTGTVTQEWLLWLQGLADQVFALNNASPPVPPIFDGVTGSGTAGRIAKWLATKELTNSIISESGTVVTIDGSLIVASGIGGGGGGTGAAGATGPRGPQGPPGVPGLDADDAGTVWPWPATSASASVVFTTGSVIFAGPSGALAQDNANFFWDDTYNRLGIGTSTNLSRLTVLQGANLTNIGGTTTANATMTITGVGTQFTRLARGDRLALSSAPSTYATVVGIASDTSLTVDAVLGNGTTQTIDVHPSIVRVDDNFYTDINAVRVLVNELGVGINMQPAGSQDSLAIGLGGPQLPQLGSWISVYKSTNKPTVDMYTYGSSAPFRISANGTAGRLVFQLGSGDGTRCLTLDALQKTLSLVRNNATDTGTDSLTDILLSGIEGQYGVGTNVVGSDIEIRSGRGTGSALGGGILLRTTDAGASGSGQGTMTTKAKLHGSGGLSLGTTTDPGAANFLLTGSVMWNGITASFPALNRSVADPTTLRVRLADDTAFTSLKAGELYANSNNAGGGFMMLGGIAADRNYGGIWIGQATPGFGNYCFLANSVGGQVFFNSPGGPLFDIEFRIQNVTHFTVGNAGVMVNGTPNTAPTRPFTVSNAANTSTLLTIDNVGLTSFTGAGVSATAPFLGLLGPSSSYFFVYNNVAGGTVFRVGADAAVSITGLNSDPTVIGLSINAAAGGAWTPLAVTSSGGATGDVFTIGATFNVGIGTTAFPITGSKGLVFGDGTALATMGTNTAGFYAEDVGGTVKMFTITEAGVAGEIAMVGSGTAMTAGSVLFVGTTGGLATDPTNFFWDDTNNRLGIGTAAPSNELHVYGIGEITRFDGSSNYVGWAVGGVPYGYIGNSPTITSGGTAGDFTVRSEAGLNFSTGGSPARMFIASTGNVGIGVSTSLTKTLTVNGAMTFLRSAGVPGGFVGPATWASNFMTFQNAALTESSSNFALTQSNAGQTILNSVSGQTLELRVGNGTALTISGTGANVGIGNAGMPFPASGSYGLFFIDGTAPTSLGLDTAGFFGNDVSGTVHMFAISEAGITMQLTGAANNTLATAVQGNITSTGALNAGSITSGFGSIDVGADSITGGAITGTTGAFSDVVTVNLNAAAVSPSPFTGVLLHLAQVDATPSRMVMDAFGSLSQIILRKANGTNASKSALVADDLIGHVGASGYGATGYSSGNRAAMDFFAAENWTDSAQGAYINFFTVPTGSTTLAERMRITAAGLVGISTTVPTSLLTVSSNATALPAPLAGTVLHLGATESTVARIQMHAFAVQGALTFTRANTSAASPSALAIDETIGAFTASGYGSTTYGASTRARINLVAGQTWTDANQGTYIAFLTTPNNTTSTAEGMRLFGSAGVSIGNTTDPGATNLSVTGTVTMGGIPRFNGTNTTGAGSAALGANSPATTNTAPYTWLRVTTADGSAAYVPCWK